MTLAPAARSFPVPDAVVEDRPDLPRVRLRGGPATGMIDGAWWPRTSGLASEIPTLMGALAPAVGTVTRVGFHRADWSEADRSRSAVGPVEVDGAGAARHTVRVRGSHGSRTLLVLPLWTGEMRAAEILAAVLVHGTRLGVPELLHPSGPTTWATTSGEVERHSGGRGEDQAQWAAAIVRSTQAQ
ncbi:hypothetical protein GCM10009836_38420 [Pseudonocardia ailaonensis]|uniref:Uncharacterized protein n=1 Tax=Pseudonocardia ailaonensis TaxID=367279 RepID=A0ABN2N655_9PSEU